MKALKGICPAIVTPFDRYGEFDPAAMRRTVAKLRRSLESVGFLKER